VYVKNIIPLNYTTKRDAMRAEFWSPLQVGDISHLDWPVYAQAGGIADMENEAEEGVMNPKRLDSNSPKTGLCSCRDGAQYVTSSKQQLPSD
jgi:hypothetical protein